MSYSAIVSRLVTRPHPNADRLQLGQCAGSQVVVGLDVQSGALGVFFPCDGQLSHEMCLENSLYNESALKDLLPLLRHADMPTLKYGFFSANRRVRSQKFRGEKSDGFWTELSSLTWTGYDLTQLKDGDTFSALNGAEVCNKYYTPATLRAMKQAATHGKKAPDAVFPKHADTEQFRYAIGHLPEGSIIYITEKQHGTSMRYGHVLETLPPTWWQRFMAGITNRKAAKQEWTYLNGSKNVCLEKTTGAGYYGTNEFRYDVVKDIALHKGEVLYGEIVGFVGPDAAPIMNPQAIEDKALAKVYGPTMLYTYGCPAGIHRLFIYKITRLNVDGIETELSWPQVVQRCGELGLNTVRLLTPPIVYRGEVDTEELVAKVELHTEGVSTFDDRHIREGVVVRVESDRGITYYKNKGFTFGVLEGYIKTNDDYVDMEEAA